MRQERIRHQGRPRKVDADNAIEIAHGGRQGGNMREHAHAALPPYPLGERRDGFG